MHSSLKSYGFFRFFIFIQDENERYCPEIQSNLSDTYISIRHIEEMFTIWLQTEWEEEKKNPKR